MSRVAILDSAWLDNDLLFLLLDPLKHAFASINSSLPSKLEPEVALILQAVLYKFSVWDSASSYGTKLQGLHYTYDRARNHYLSTASAVHRIPRLVLLCHSTLTILLPYIHLRTRIHALSRSWPEAPVRDYRRKAWDVLSHAEALIGILNLFNFLAFLQTGRYRAFADRLTGMALTPTSKVTRNDVSYEFMNRQMAWQAFTEFLLFALPLVRSKSLKRRLTATITQFVPQGLPFMGQTQPTSFLQASRPSKGPYWSLPHNQCAICAQDASFEPPQDQSVTPNHSLEPDSVQEVEGDHEEPSFSIHLPYVASCGHIYCYHCLAERILRTSDDQSTKTPNGSNFWSCLRCGAQVTSAHRRVAVVSSEGNDVLESDLDFTSNDSDSDIGSLQGGRYPM